MSVIPNLATIALDANGAVAPAARMYWFLAGTETPATVYSNSTLTTPHSHPIDADAGGEFAPVYAAAGTYKVRITKSAAAGGATLYEVDNFEVATSGTELNFPTSVKTANFSVTADDRGKVFLCDASGIGGLVLVITADSATLGEGFPFFAVNNAATGTITVQGTGGQLINGAASVSVATRYESTGLVSIGAAGWQVVLSSPTITLPLMFALSDETTAITTGIAKLTFRMPFAFTVDSVRASLTTASSSGIPTVDINEAGVSILSTKLTIDANELTSTTAATPYVLSDTSLANDAEITFDIDVAGTGAKGLKVYIIGRKI